MANLVLQQEDTINAIETTAAGVEDDTKEGYVSTCSLRWYTG